MFLCLVGPKIKAQRKRRPTSLQLIRVDIESAMAWLVDYRTTLRNVAGSYLTVGLILDHLAECRGF